MFTGLVETVGTIRTVARTDAGLTLRIESVYDDLAPGESVAVNGACLTVRGRVDAQRIFEVAAIETTLARTTIGSWRAGKRVNLERALRLGDRLGGHLVQGHVDGVAKVEDVTRSGDAVVVSVSVPGEVWRLLAAMGSVALDGVSLTVHGLPEPSVLQVSLIDYTLSHTTLANVAVGDELHIEADMIAKQVDRLLRPYDPSGAP